MNTATKQTLLLTRLSALGDIVHTWPLAELLGKVGRYRVVWLVEESFLPLVKYHPGVAEVIPVASKRWRRRLASLATRREVRAVLEAIRQQASSIAIDPQGLVKSALWAALAGVPQRLGLSSSHRRETLAGLFYTQRVAPPPQLSHVVDFNLALAQPLVEKVTFGTAPDGSFLRAHLPQPPAEARSVLLLPGSGNVKKSWAPASFAELASSLLAQGWPVTVLWGPKEREVAAAIVREVPGCRLAPPTDLWQLAAWLNAALAVIGGDTGPVHLAASMGVPTVALHLITDPKRNCPRGARVAVVSGARQEQALRQARTGPARSISPQEVLQAFHELMHGSV